MEFLLWTLRVLCILCALFLFAVMPRARRKSAEPYASAEYAHRGLWGKGVAENSLSAFALAAERGCGIELDVQLSSDGEVVVFHDESLLRVTGCDALVHDKDVAFLKTLRLSGTEDTLPTLREVLALVDGRVPLLVEIKSDYKWKEVCEKAAALLDGYKGAYCVESFHPLCVRWFRKHRPNVVRGQLSTRLWKENGKRTLSYAVVQNLLLNFCARPDFIAYDVKHRGYIAFLVCRLWRPYTLAWTVKTKEELEAAERFDGVIFENEEIFWEENER